MSSKIDESDFEDVFKIVTDYGATSYMAGFYTGLKAGAKLMQNLTDEAGIIF